MLLTVNIPDEQAEILGRIMQGHGGKLLVASQDDGGEQLGYLLGFTGFCASKTDKLKVGQQCIVFSGVDGRELNAILGEMRSEGVVIALKAICTAYNQRWRLIDLACELEKEHRAMNGGGRLE